MMDNEILSHAQIALNLVREWVLEPPSADRLLSLSQHIVNALDGVRDAGYDQGWIDADRAWLEGEMDADAEIPPNG